MSSGSLRYHDPPSQTDARVYTLQNEVYTTTTPYNFQINGESLILLTKNKPTGFIGVRQTTAAIASAENGGPENAGPKIEGHSTIAASLCS